MLSSFLGGRKHSCGRKLLMLSSFLGGRKHRLLMLSIFRVMTVYSIFLLRYFADAPFFNCVAGRMGLQVRSAGGQGPAGGERRSGCGRFSEKRAPSSPQVRGRNGRVEAVGA
jgi:hypothetical protein